MAACPRGISTRRESNIATASIAGMLLDKGTTKQDKFAIAKKLDDVGARSASTSARRPGDRRQDR